MRGTFFVIEGIDGAGKSTVALELTRGLSAQGMPTLHTYEPYPSFITDTIYDVLYRQIDEPAPRVMATLFAAARLHHTTTVLEPALADGLNIVCDRYIFSTFAYNTSTAVTRSDVEGLHQSFYLAPDHVFYLHCDPAFAAARLQARPTRQTIYEADLAKLARAAQLYETMFQAGQVDVCQRVSHVHRVDAMQPLADVMQTLWSTVAALPLLRPPT